MTRSHFWTRNRKFALALLGVGLLFIALGFMVDGTLAQETEQATQAPAARATSIFDQPAQSGAASPTLASTPTTQPAASVTPESAAPAATRVHSIFDPPAQQPTTQPPTAGAAASTGPTRVPSIFDPPAQPTAAPGGSTPGRVGSIFDTPATAAPGSGGTVGSIFDAAPLDVIRFPGEEQPDQEYCLSCHENPYLQMTLPSGEVISVAVDGAAYSESVHGQHGTEGYRCIRCHEGMNDYPHAEVTAQTARDLTIELSTSCSRCHPDKYDETLDGAHFALLMGGDQNAAVCSDCHTGHEVEALRDPVTRQPLETAAITSVEMCSECHAEVFAHYAESVHGRAVLEGNQDAATCSDCHGVHDTTGPITNTTFKLFSPDICASCHADEEMMAKYNISTDVFDTYVADFHGTTVSIFQRTAAGQEFNSPVCVDCHGVHNITAVSEEDGPTLKENLVGMCQRCHPGATTNFPDAWMSHYAPSLERTPVTTIATAAYAILIPAVIGGLGVFVISDARRRRRNRREEESDHDEE
ncbi:MAG: hypothetical protein U0452_12430 [Anaerolineae bacterium]